MLVNGPHRIYRAPEIKYLRGPVILSSYFL